MAEALGLASSIVALVQLSASVYSATSKFYREAKEAKSKIGALATQARNLSGVLQSLSLLASSPLFDDAGASIPDFRDTYIDSCHTTLHKIKRKLEKAEVDFETGSHRKLLTRSLKWPFESQETKDLIDELGEHRDVLQLALSADSMSHLLQCLANTNSIAKTVDSINRKLDRKASIDTRVSLTAKREEIAQFFLKVNPEDHLHDCRDRRQPKTGKWLIERDETFRNWMGPAGSLVWLSGIPGAGKTILCGTVVDEILQEQTPNTGVAFFFCDYKYPESHKSVNILSTLAVQLAKQADVAFEMLESYHQELHPNNRIAKPPETKRMIEVVQKMIDHYDRVYLVVDGLDECGSNVVEVLQSLMQLTQGSDVKMALFSRVEPDIIEVLSDSPRIEIAAHTEDLELYVLAQMESRKRLKGLAVKSPELHEHIRHTLIQGANGMFRWVACQLDHLDGLPSDGRRRKALTELPPTLFETYDRILDRIMQEDENDQQLCQKALHLMGLGYDNIDPLALCEAISIPEDQDLVDKDLLVEPDWVSRSCSSLVRLAQHSSDHPHFELAHFTVKEYLRSIKPQSKRALFRFCEDEATRSLLETSLRFLTSPTFDRKPTVSKSETKNMAERNEDHPFYPVAADYLFCWASSGWQQEINEQFSLVLEDEMMMECAIKLFNPDKTGTFLSWVIQFAWASMYHPNDEDHLFGLLGTILAPEFTTLHVAAMLALPQLCAYLIDIDRANLNTCGRLGAPLHALLAGLTLPHVINYSCDNGWEQYRHLEKPALQKYDQPRKCLEIFLEHGADTSLQWNKTSVLEMAWNSSIRSQYDQLWVSPLINQSTIVYEDFIQRFRSSLVHMMHRGIEQPVIDVIFTTGSPSDAAPGWARLASLIQTWRMRSVHHEEGSDLAGDLLNTISDEDFVDGLRISVSQHLTDTLKAYVQDPRFRPDMCIHRYIPVLHHAIQNSSLKSLEVLLEAGCDPNLVDKDGGFTALHQCALSETGDAAITSLLLRSGASDSIKTGLGSTCWHVAAERGNVSVLKVLIEMSRDTKQALVTTSGEGRSPLASAILHAKVESALFILDHCQAELEFFQSNDSLLAKAASIGDENLFVRLHEKLEETGATEAINNSNPLGNIKMTCSPELFDYLLRFWVPKSDEKSNALTNYLLDANEVDFNHPEQCPSHNKMEHIIRGLLPLGHVFVNAQKVDTHYWEIFCQKAVPQFTKSCTRNDCVCCTDVIITIFEVLINIGLLDSFERNGNILGYRRFVQALLSRGTRLGCTWIHQSVHKVIKAYGLPGELAAESVSIELLSHAVRHNTIGLVRQLLNHGVDVHTAHGFISPLEQACHSANLPIFWLVVEHLDKTLINRPGYQGKTLLHWAASGERGEPLEKIEHLLHLGAHVDSVVDDPDADTALILASRRFRPDVVALLASKGADSTRIAWNGWTILHAAAEEGDLRFIQHLVPSETPESFWLSTCNIYMKDYNDMAIADATAMHFAACNGKCNVLKHLIEKQVPFDVNAVTGHPSLTPLHFASWQGRLDAVKILISNGADVNLKDSLGRRAIDMPGADPTIVKVLLDSGSERTSRQVLASGRLGVLPPQAFEAAIRQGLLGICQGLAKDGYSINAKFASCSCTPLVCALTEGQTAVVDWLVSAGAKLTNLSCKIHSSLQCITSLGAHHISSPKTFGDILNLALIHNVNWYGTGLSPLHVAILDDKMEILEMTLKHIREHEHQYREMIESEAISLPVDTRWRDRSTLSILVNEVNRDDAFTDPLLWDVTMPPGSPLHWAVRHNNVSAVKLLLQNEADVNQVDSVGRTPLLLATWKESSQEILKELLNAGAGPAGRLDAILEATNEGDLEVIKILTEADPETLRAADRFSVDGLMYLAGSVEVFQYLLSQGLDLSNHKHIVLSTITDATTLPQFRGFIFNSGLLPQSTKELIEDAFAVSLDSDNFLVTKWLYRTFRNDYFPGLLNGTRPGWASPLCLEASRNAEKKGQDLISMGAEIDVEGSPYGSPLMVACVLGSFDMARRLVRSGASLFYVNQDGLLRSALALSSRHPRIKRWLLVDRHVEQPKLEYEPLQTTSHQSAWSGPRLFKLALPAYMHRDFEESRWDHLQRLQRWKEELLGSVLSESRGNSGLDFEAEREVESRKTEAQAAHRQFLARLGED